MAEATPEGVALTKVEVNALSPDGITAVLKRITDDVLKLIPEGALEKIAKEVISSGRICLTARDQWNNDRNTVVLSDVAKEKMADRLRKQIEDQVEAYFRTAEVQAFVAEAASHGVAEALKQVPGIAGGLAAQRICNGFATQDVPQIAVDTARINDRLQIAMNNAHQALVNRGVLAPHEAPTVH